MNILYVGESNPKSTSFHRANALTRLGHFIILINPYQALGIQLRNPIIGRIHYYLGFTFIQEKIFKWIKSVANKTENYDLIWINSGELLGSKSLQFLRSFNVPVILYNNDDPTGNRDGNRFKTLLKSISYYDLCVVRKEKKEADYELYKAKKVYKVFMSYDEVAHLPFNQQIDIPKEFISDVAFIGTWMRFEKRDEFLMKLIAAGLKISIWGDRWEKSPYWHSLKKYYKGKSLSGREYVAAIQGAKICLGFLSKGNSDLHTRRSVEIPFSGGLLCAQRTSLHQEMYIENKEALFWDDANECAAICKQILLNENLREQIRQSGMEKVRALEVGNENICKNIINEIFNQTGKCA
jgi:hypothetical protein